MIFAYRRKDWVRSKREYANVCRKLRDVAVEYLEFRNPQVNDLDHFMGFMRRHGPLTKTVQSLHLLNVHLDATLVLEIRQLFPNLTSLALSDIVCNPPSPYNHPQSDPPENPLPEALKELEDLKIDCRPARADSGWSLTGLMHILSLLSARKLLIWMHDGMCFRDKFDPSCLAGTSAVQNVHVLISQIPKKSMANVMNALSVTLAPDVLQGVEVEYDSKPTLRALGSLLDRIGGNVTNLTIYPLVRWTLEERKKWTDPFDDWTLLDIRACKKLESLHLPIYVRPKENLKPQRPLSHIAVGLLANYAAPTLREIIIDIHDLERPTTLGNRTVLRLQEFDKVVTQARFPNLQRFAVCVTPTRTLWNKANCNETCLAAIHRALPGLRARGILIVSFRRWHW
ncbi:hypothetical protein OH76DRAFT_1406192 [Lentinus brumalis]|uniref:F-box domain-containing protein n=1 Tax=Lentinus brumalis TaxID=2498619 RepID=A0A371D416_9APHY|nr:hypothetical protein OH76DRAFT_1406192 [Polyporus brumalis]